MDSVRAAIANLAVSGIKVSPFCVDMMYKIQNKELSYSQALEILKEKYISKLHNKIYEAFNDNTDDPIEIIEDGEWEVDRKYQSRVSIVKFECKYYSITKWKAVK